MVRYFFIKKEGENRRGVNKNFVSLKCIIKRNFFKWCIWKYFGKISYIF